MLPHADVGVIFASFGCRNQDQGGVEPCGKVCLSNQLPAVPLSLESRIASQVKQIRTVTEVGQCLRDSRQRAIDPCRSNDRSMPQHSRNFRRVTHWTAFCQYRTEKQVDELFCSEFGSLGKTTSSLFSPFSIQAQPGLVRSKS